MNLLRQGNNVDKALLENAANKERELKLKKQKLIQDFNSNKVAEYKKTVSTDHQFTAKVKSYLTH